MFKLRRGTALYSIVKCKCPKCQDGDLFKNKNPYALRQLFDMPDCCPVCGQDFRIEPGFYLGAMWVSYPVVIFLFILFVLLAHFIIGMHMVASLVSATALLILLCPLLIRYARAVFLHMFAG